MSYLHQKRIFDLVSAYSILNIARPIYYFTSNTNIYKIISLCKKVILRSHSFVAPRYEENFNSKAKVLKVLNVEEGIFSPFFLHRLANMQDNAYSFDWDKHLKQASFIQDLCIIAKCLPYLIFQNKKIPSSMLYLMNFTIYNYSTDNMISYLISRLKLSAHTKVGFLNTHTINLSHTCPQYKKRLQKFDILMSDGIGLRIAAYLCNQSVNQNLNGTDLIPSLLKRTPANTKVFLLGASKKCVDKVVIKMKSEFSHLDFIGHHHGYLDSKSNANIINTIKKTNTQLLLVAMGNPHQETWIHDNIDDSMPIMSIGVGGFFDFYSEHKKRAPLWIRQLSCEWIYRLYLEPKRMFSRYVIGNISFLFRTLRY